MEKDMSLEVLNFQKNEEDSTPSGSLDDRDDSNITDSEDEKENENDTDDKTDEEDNKGVISIQFL